MTQHRMTQHRMIGDAGVLPIGMGCWAIGGPYWSGKKPVGWGVVDDKESTAALHRALELGITFFDTADSYGAGHSERVLGKALAGHRDEAFIATKWGNVFDEETRQSRAGDAQDLPYLRSAVEASLRRLDTDRIDLYQCHLGGATAEEAAVLRDALEELVTAGKIRSYGWSTDDPARPEAMAGPHFVAVQHELNVLSDAPGMLSVVERHGWAGINRGPLAMGLLSSKYTAETRLSRDDVRGDEPEWMKYFSNGSPARSWLERRDAIREILMSGGRSLVQGALAWIWARSPRTIPIPGFRTVAQVEENAGALEYGPLSAGALAEIDVILGRSAS